MTPNIIAKHLVRRVAGGLRSFFSIQRFEIDFVLIVSFCAALVCTILRFEMLNTIAIANSWTGSHHFRALYVIMRSDILLLEMLTVTCLLVCFFVYKTGFRRAVIAVYWIVLLCNMILLSANVELAPMYSTQLDLSLLQFSDLLNGSATTVTAVLPSTFLWNLLLILGGLFALPCLAFSQFYHVHKTLFRHFISATIFLGIFSFGIIPTETIARNADVDPKEAQNSAVYFLSSLGEGSQLLSSGAPISGDSATTEGLKESPEPNNPAFPEPPANVLVIVLESVGADYFELLSDQGLLPSFVKIESHGVYFRNAYASAPVSNVSLVGMLTSTGPLANYKLVTRYYPRANFTTSYQVLKSRGFRTSFFWSNDSRFLGIDEFLANRGIDLNQDYRGRSCEESRSLHAQTSAFHFLYSADSCTALSLLNWIDSNDRQPFFATLWTEQTHYPYEATESCTKAIAAKSAGLKIKSDNENWLRYAGALCDTDRMMSTILAGLQSRQKLDNTLLVIVGDHGEGFGKHGDFIHGSELFENDIRVPLLISVGDRLKARVDSRLASHLDIAPTISAAFGLLPLDQWEGKSLFGKQERKRIFFYAGWGSYKIGYREENDKYVYDVLEHRLYRYDLANDPNETSSTAGMDEKTDTAAISLIKQWYLQRIKFAAGLD